MADSTSPHVIRLRAPWQLELEKDSSSSGSGHHDIRWKRSFGKPTGLQPEDTVELAIDAPLFSGTAWLNGHLLGNFDKGITARFEIASQLQSRNDLRLEIRLAEAVPMAALDDAVGEVRLEIRG